MSVDSLQIRRTWYKSGRYYYWRCPWCDREITCFNDRHCLSTVWNHLVSHDVAMPILLVALEMVYDTLQKYRTDLMVSGAGNEHAENQP